MAIKSQVPERHQGIGHLGKAVIALAAAFLGEVILAIVNPFLIGPYDLGFGMIFLIAFPVAFAIAVYFANKLPGIGGMRH